MKITAAAHTHQGNVRENNEDNFYMNGTWKLNTADNEISRTDEQVWQCYYYAVCDGVGGADAGEVASLRAVEGIHEYLEKGGESMTEAAFAGNENVCRARAERFGSQMGSTYAALSLKPAGLMKKLTARACNAGDSRVYLFRDNRLTQLTKDHSRTQQMIDAGMMTGQNF